MLASTKSRNLDEVMVFTLFTRLKIGYVSTSNLFREKTHGFGSSSYYVWRDFGDV